MTATPPSPRPRPALPPPPPPGVAPLAMNHVNLPARDPDALSRWYVEKLGFRPNGRFLWSGGSLLVFVRGEPVASGALHVGCRLPSLEALHAWVAALRARGVAVPDVEGDATYSTTRVLDPEGNEIEVFFEPVPA